MGWLVFHQVRCLQDFGNVVKVEDLIKECISRTKKILDEKNVDNKLIKELFSNLNEEEMAEIFQMDETEAEEIVIKKFLPHLVEVILEEIDRVKTYRVDKIELELDKINGKWEITAEN